MVGVCESTLHHFLSFCILRMEGRIRIDFHNTTNKIILINFVVVRSDGCKWFRKAVELVLWRAKKFRRLVVSNAVRWTVTETFSFTVGLRSRSESYEKIWYHIIRYDIIWYEMIRYDTIYDTIWYDTTWYNMIYDMKWYDAIWYMIWYDIVYDMTMIW